MKKGKIIIYLSGLCMLALLFSCNHAENETVVEDETSKIASPAPLDSLPKSDYVPIHDRAFSSIDETIATLYEIISGPAGPRDWDKMRELCLPGADFSSFGKKEDGSKVFRKGTIDSYIQNSGPFFEGSAFYETEIGRKVDQFGHVAHVFSAYQFSLEKGGEIKARGINSIQLVKDQGRWYIANVIWDSETELEKIPIEYLR